MGKYIFSLLILMLALSSCEQIIEFPQKENDMLTVCAVAVTGQPLEVHVSKSVPVDKVPNFYDRGFDVYTKESKEFYDNNVLIRDAVVELSVNGVAKCKLHFNEESLCYQCDYVPHAGETLSLTVSAEDYPQAHCTTTVPETASELSDIEYEVYYDKAATPQEREEANRGRDWDQYGADSIMTISFQFEDPVSIENYYRLRVRSVGKFKSMFSQTADSYTACDVFSSNDPIFYDIDLKKGYGSWSAFFSNVFDDHLIDGKNYHLTVNSRKRIDPETFTIIELQSISPDLYYFLKTMQIYRISTDDCYQTPVGLYCNVVNGWGYFGAINTHSYTIVR